MKKTYKISGLYFDYLHNEAPFDMVIEIFVKDPENKKSIFDKLEDEASNVYGELSKFDYEEVR